MQIRYLTVEELTKIHEYILKETGGERGLLSLENLESCFNNPKLQVFGVTIFLSLSEKAASLLHDIAKLHPFVDGNKRTGYLAAEIFLILNGDQLVCETEETVLFTVEVAKCTKNHKDIVVWINEHRE